MQMNATPRPALTMTLMLALVSGACQGRAGGGTESAVRDSTAPAAGSKATATDSAKSSGSTDSSALKAGLNDETILGMLDRANSADSTLAKLAAKQATDPAVKEFANMMMKDHHDLRASGEEVAKKLGVTPKPPAKDPVAGYSAGESAQIQKAKKGADFDKTYIDNEVTVHQAVLDAVNMARVSSSSPEVKDLLQKAIPVVRAHLEQAMALQKRLNPTT
jgi:putative membrane protein